MKLRAAKMAFGIGAVLLSLLPNPLWSQATAALSGVAGDPSGKAIPNAKISIKSVETGKAVETESDSAGLYKVSNLTAGNYEVTAAAEGYIGNVARVTLAEGKQATLNLTLAPGSAPQQSPTVPVTPQLPNAPSSSTTAPSLGDLGFTPQQTQANPQLQAMLQKRTEMLKMHQRLGLITAIPMAAAVITGPMAKAKGKNGQTITEPTTANLDVHAALGGVTTALYFSTAYFAMFAPRVPGTKKHGAIRIHEALAWVHGPGMILTPVLGYMAYKQENSGEKAHGIAAQHGTVAYITSAAYGASIVAVSWPIHVKFWEKR